MHLIQPIIRCGTGEDESWPLSRPLISSQFVNVFCDRSTFQHTLLRVQDPELFARPVVITDRSHRFVVERQLADVHIAADVILEPCFRGSGPAVLAGCLAMERKAPKASVLVLPADQMVWDVAAFRAAVVSGQPAAIAGHVVTFGVAPTHPIVDCGFIEPEASPAAEALVVGRFLEKPDLATAARYVLSGCLLNSRNYLLTPGTLFSKYIQFDLGTVRKVTSALDFAVDEGGTALLNLDFFAGARIESIDRALTKYADRCTVIRMACGWSDIGSCGSAWALGTQHGSAIVAEGDPRPADRHGHLTTTNEPSRSRPVIVANQDAIMIAQPRQGTELQWAIEALRLKEISAANAYVRIHRPWGWYQTIGSGQKYRVSRVVIYPNRSVSLLELQLWAKNWVVVDGTAKLVVGDAARFVRTNEHIQLPLGVACLLKNAGSSAVELVEVQSCTVEEDDTGV
jgi:mannose-1-phosphate guanylyltransferase / mannose-6-phosphate isomerase